jgi:hypothetical protein
MDDTTKTRTFMRGDVKNARAEELLALLKAEREMNDSTEIPNTLKKRPLLPAIRQTSRDESCFETANFPVTKLNSRFLWKDLDWEETLGNEIENSERRHSDSFIKQNWENPYGPYENTAKNLPPLKARRRYSQNVVRPGCPEPPMTPCFDES